MTCSRSSALPFVQSEIACMDQQMTVCSPPACRERGLRPPVHNLGGLLLVFPKTAKAAWTCVQSASRGGAGGDGGRVWESRMR
eukprot:3579873-Pyramimonas_sp.AAC.1